MPLSYADPGANLVLKKVSEEGLDLVLESEKSRATATVVYKVILHRAQALPEKGCPSVT